MKKKIISYVIAFTIAIGIFFLVCGLRGILTEEKDKVYVIITLCDAFFVPAVFFMGIGALVWASDEGAFDGLGYSVSSLINLHKPVGRGLDWKEKESFQKYVERKHKKSGKKTKNIFFIIGAIFLIVAIILLIVYYTLI
ncbi:MAG: DUF3899 domain-containing protein [Eubacteriales bacterium]|nr:DUF3899 domain-containing protein [Christensenellaceae bacterium]MDY3241743.1 DUF3899 domain-containing protein [Eubacteriales bacterium]